MATLVIILFASSLHAWIDMITYNITRKETESFELEMIDLDIIYCPKTRTESNSQPTKHPPQLPVARLTSNLVGTRNAYIKMNQKNPQAHIRSGGKLYL